MDEQVIAAMARWPDVPAVFGWLSLTETGHWRLHPQGDALQESAGPGEEITSPQILAFMNRNYAADELGQWYFQNGPQRVYVRLDAAPYIAHTTTEASSGRFMLRTHTGLDIRELLALYLTPTGHLYAATDRGAALIAGRDLPAFLDALQTHTSASGAKEEDVNEALSRCLEKQETVALRSGVIAGFPEGAVELHHCAVGQLENRMGFRRRPQANESVAGPNKPPAEASGA